MAESIFHVTQQSGGVRVAAVVPFSVVCLVPDNLDPRNCQLSIRNTDLVAVMSFKWVPSDRTGTSFEPNDAAVQLLPGDAFDWLTVRPGSALIGRSTIDQALLAVDFQGLLLFPYPKSDRVR